MANVKDKLNHYISLGQVDCSVDFMELFNQNKSFLMSNPDNCELYNEIDFLKVFEIISRADAR